jgi:ATP-dependent helicase/nuclease subunit B
MTGEPRVFSIHPGAPFLPTLVRAILDGNLVPGHRFRDDPLALADLTIFLPTRRAARALSGAFLDALGGTAAILPRIRPLGDIDDDQAFGLVDPVDLDLPPAIGESDRLLALARLIVDWRRHVSLDRLLTPSGQPIQVPGSTADAVHLARELLSLLDQAAAETVDWTQLSRLVPEDHAAWWQMTLTFLEIATAAWPQHLKEMSLLDPVERRTRISLGIAARLEEHGSRGPMIAAGSTGSVPATARLIRSIAGLGNGAVVLPGLDFDLPEPMFEDLTGLPGAPSHPQAAMARLLSTIGIDRRDVRPLGAVPAAGILRARIVSEALLPAEYTDSWPTSAATFERTPEAMSDALGGVKLMVAANEAEEALGVALALRETLETPGATAALVTPDRGLARRVCHELARFGVTAEDSAGTPMARTRTGVLALLTAEVALDGLPPNGLVALMKHPLASFGMDRPRARAAARALELAVLRGPRLAAGSDALVAAADRLCSPAGRAATMLDAARLDDARRIARRVREALRPLEALKSEEHVTLARFLEAEMAALRAVVADPEGSDARLFEGAAGTAFTELAAAFLASPGADLTIRPREAPTMLRALMAGETVRRPHAQARVSIWGPLEARMMTVDRLVVGGLNEGVWPMATDTGPWLSRPMRAGLAFSPPESRIGLSAHDFAQSLGCADVVLTRSLKRAGAPTVPTRFLQRLTGLIGKERSQAMEARGADFVRWARALDEGPRLQRIERPNPKPPLAARPKRLSVTEIETWIRDPYAIYARRILRLEPLKDLGERPDFGTRGTVLHAALAEFAAVWKDPYDKSAVTALIETGRRWFDQEFGAYPEIYALWWPRFVAVAGFVVEDFEATCGQVERLPEQTGEWQVFPGEDGFVLRGRADRIDIQPDGRVSIVDFKSGTAPSDRQIATAKAPQMPLEAAIAARGGFGVVGPVETSELVHVVLKGIRGRDEVRRYVGLSAKDLVRDLPETIAEAERRLIGLIEAYRDPDKPYLSRAHPFRQSDRGDYDHLARVKEWSIASDQEGGEE